MCVSSLLLEMNTFQLKCRPIKAEDRLEVLLKITSKTAGDVKRGRQETTYTYPHTLTTNTERLSSKHQISQD